MKGMSYGDYISHAERYFYRHRLRLSPSAVQALASPSYLSPSMLNEMPRRRLERNINRVFRAVDKASGSELRASGEPLRAAHIRPILKLHFCRLPPSADDYCT
jgi:hypothetical protein